MNYLHLDKVSQVTKKMLESYWDRKNCLVIVKLGTENFLVFLVEDVGKPEIPGYPATAIEYFKSFDEALKEIGKCYKRIGYTPKHLPYTLNER